MSKLHRKNISMFIWAYKIVSSLRDRLISKIKDRERDEKKLIGMSILHFAVKGFKIHDVQHDMIGKLLRW